LELGSLEVEAEAEAEGGFLFNPENKEVITVPAYRISYLSIFKAGSKH
jgi:hypothetical protein